MIDPVIELNNVSFSYNGNTVLQKIGLTVYHNDFLVMIGPNGGGKTTLLKLILGLLPPDSGTVKVFGETPAKNRYRLGYVPQNIPANKGFPVSVLDVALMGRLGHKTSMRQYTKADKAVVQKAMETVDIWEYKNERIDNLSGGQRQRVYIARALAAEPEVLLLDEPTASIDMEGQAKIYKILKNLNTEMTIIVVSHDYALTLGYAKTVAHINKTMHVHEALDFTPEMFLKLENSSLKDICPIELIKEYLQIKATAESGTDHV
ncbi:MAG: ABC transporter ATP-binding protein [Candidatus Latescibacteria bacterium]|nr:ABC transporter ATP-binding protein [Candidatus Latescibacterota bacterium]